MAAAAGPPVAVVTVIFAPVAVPFWELYALHCTEYAVAGVSPVSAKATSGAGPKTYCTVDLTCVAPTLPDLTNTWVRIAVSTAQCAVKDVEVMPVAGVVVAVMVAAAADPGCRTPASSATVPTTVTILCMGPPGERDPACSAGLGPCHRGTSGRRSDIARCGHIRTRGTRAVGHRTRRVM